MAVIEFLEQQTQAVSDFRKKLDEWRARRADLKRAITSLRKEIDGFEQNARAVVAQGLDDEARDWLARKLAAQKRLDERDSELQQVQAQKISLHAEGCAVAEQGQAFNLAVYVNDFNERQARVRLQAECRYLERELSPIRFEIAIEEDRRRRHAMKAEQATRPTVAVSGPPLGERNSRVIPQDVKIAVSARDQGKCRQCGSTQELHFDHVIPWSRGGANTAANIQLLCGPCNRRKGAEDIPAY